MPLRLAWALTVHKSQGATLDRVRVDLAGCFAPGQALARARAYVSPDSPRAAAATAFGFLFARRSPSDDGPRNVL